MMFTDLNPKWLSVQLRSQAAGICLVLLSVVSSVLLLWVAPSNADEPVTMISHDRVKLVDVVPEVAPGLANIDLGRAPPPGRSRYFSYDEMASRLRAAGVAASRLKLPRGVRVESKARQFSSEELEQMVEESVRKSLPPGIHLEEISVESPLVLSPTVTAGRVRLPHFTTKNGRQAQIGTVEILWGDQVALRLPVKMNVRIDGETVGHIVKRGSSVTLLIRRGSVEISALAQTLSTGRVGDVVSLRVGVTKKVMSARLVAPERAELEI